MVTLTKKDLLTPITEKKQCCYCIHVINYGWHAVKAESRKTFSFEKEGISKTY